MTDEKTDKGLSESTGQATELRETMGGEIITIESAEDLISIAQRRFDIVSKTIKLALKFTTYRDWVNQEGQPYLVHSGAERIARLFGITLSNITTNKVWSEDSKGRFYIYKTTGKASLPGKFDSIEGLGTCSQRDKFFAFKNGEYKDTLLIDETNIMKASYSNFVVNAITHLLGLRNITWEDLKQVGMDTTKMAKVEYQAGAKQTAKAALTTGAISKTEAIWQICVQLAAGDDEQARAALREFSKFHTKPNDKEPEGKEVYADSIKALTTERWIDMTYKNARAAFEKAYPGEPVPGNGQATNLAPQESKQAQK